MTTHATLHHVVPENLMPEGSVSFKVMELLVFCCNPFFAIRSSWKLNLAGQESSWGPLSNGSPVSREWCFRHPYIQLG
jgi:hypothetical protein